MFSMQSLRDSGYPNALTCGDWIQFCREQISVGSFWTVTAYCLERRARAGRFMRRVIRLRVRPRLHAMAIQAGKYGARMKATQEIQPTGSSTVTLVSILPWNIWGRSRRSEERRVGKECFVPCR